MCVLLWAGQFVCLACHKSMQHCAVDQQRPVIDLPTVDERRSINSYVFYVEVACNCSALVSLMSAASFMQQLI